VLADHGKRGANGQSNDQTTDKQPKQSIRQSNDQKSADGQTTRRSNETTRRNRLTASQSDSQTIKPHGQTIKSLLTDDPTGGLMAGNRLILN